LNFDSFNEISETFIPVGEFVFHDTYSRVVKNTGNNPADSDDLVQLIGELIHKITTLNTYLINSTFNQFEGHTSHDQIFNFFKVESGNFGNCRERDVSVVLGKGEDELQESHNSDFFIKSLLVVFQSRLQVG